MEKEREELEELLSRDKPSSRHHYNLVSTFNSLGDLRADLHTGGVFRDFHHEGLILESLHLIISHPKISRENRFSYFHSQ